MLLAAAVVLLAIGFGLGRWSARRGVGSPSNDEARAAPAAAGTTTGGVETTPSPAHASEVAAGIQAALPADAPTAAPPLGELREAGAGDGLDYEHVCPDLELAVARGMNMLEEMSVRHHAAAGAR